jgi:phosphotransferase system  glucose/maltose/N-acetylglucosamine-specific IIC component
MYCKIIILIIKNLLPTTKKKKNWKYVSWYIYFLIDCFLFFIFCLLIKIYFNNIKAKNVKINKNNKQANKQTNNQK